MRASTDVPLAPMTTLRLGGPAAELVEVETEAEVAEALERAGRAGRAVFVLGGGSNVVVADEGFPGLVVRMASRGVEVRREESRVAVDVAAGEDWDALVARAVDEGWGGIEAMSGIPGLVGATPIQNVGAYGQEVAETITSVRVYDREARAFAELPNEACGFAYRASRFKGGARFVVTRVRFSFGLAREGTVRYAELARALGVGEGASAPARAIRDTVVALRRSKGMVLDPEDPESVSAGSFFVNPVLSASELAALEARAGVAVPRFSAEGGRWKVPAAWLVEHAGFPKGYSVGRVGVSRKHSLALVHRGGGTARELALLASRIEAGVLARFGVRLAREPVMVGFTA
jgi:UDP-N-acetylmuramate dehydrogenase